MAIVYRENQTRPARMPPKSPGATLTYTVDLRELEWLEVGANIASANAVAVTAGITINSVVHDSDKIKISISGGTDNTNYEVLVSWTTDESTAQSDERTMLIPVKQL